MSLPNIQILDIQKKYATENDVIHYQSIINRNYHICLYDLISTTIKFSINDKIGYLTINDSCIGQHLYLSNYCLETTFTMNDLQTNFNDIVDVFLNSKQIDELIKTFLKDIQKEYNSLLKKLKVSHFQEISICIKNRQYYIQPCSYSKQPNLSNIEFFIVTPDDIIHSSNNLIEIAENIANFEDKTKEHDMNKIALEQYYTENIKGKSIQEIDDDTLTFYSDWHKDVYGYRPRNIEIDLNDIDLDDR